MNTSSLIIIISLIACSGCAAYGFQDRPDAARSNRPLVLVDTISTDHPVGEDLRLATDTLVEAIQSCGAHARWGAARHTDAHHARIHCDASSIEPVSGPDTAYTRGNLECTLTFGAHQTTFSSFGSSTLSGADSARFDTRANAQTDALIQSARAAGCKTVRELDRLETLSPPGPHGKKTTQ